MVWYYAEEGQQRGPVSDAELDEMIANGRIGRETLVWQDGMENWAPLENARASVAPPVTPQLPPVSIPPPEAALPGATYGGVLQDSCHNCGRSFAASTLTRFANVRVCQECAPAVVQQVRNVMGPTVIPQAMHAEVAPSVAGVRYGGFWLRAFAKLVDWFLISLLLSPISTRILPEEEQRKLIAAVFGGGGDREAMMQQALQYQAQFFPYLVGTLVLYNLVFVALFSATPGKLLFRLRIVSADQSRVTFSQAVARAVIPGLLMIIDQLIQLDLGKLVIMVGYFMVGWDPEKRSLFDRICRTRVVRKTG